MASQKEVKTRIASIKNIQKLTRAMEMVAAARLRRSEQRIADLRPYSEGMRKLTRIASANITGVPRIPVLVERENVQRVGIVLVTGGPGLGGRLQLEHHPRGQAEGGPGAGGGRGAGLLRRRPQGCLGADLPQT